MPRSTPARLMAIVFALFASSPAHAHLGHVGELAGHSHLAGVAAGVAAAALAGLAAWLSSREKRAKEAEQAKGQDAPEGESAADDATPEAV